MHDPSAALDHDAALRRCAGGDAVALRTLYEAEGPRMHGLALRIVRDKALAEDAVHNAFMKIWLKASTFDATRGAGRGWMYTIVRHEALNLVRDAAHEVSTDDDALAVLAEHRDVVETAPTPMLPGEAGLLARCLERLDEAKRSSLVMAYVDGYTHLEIAAQLRQPLGTVKAWIRRGLQSLRECMG